MLPKVQQSTLANTLKRDNLATQIVSQDHLRNILSKSNNQVYKPWKNEFAPKNPHSPFGDFPPEFMPKQKIATRNI